MYVEHTEGDGGEMAKLSKSSLNQRSVMDGYSSHRVTVGVRRSVADYFAPPFSEHSGPVGRVARSPIQTKAEPVSAPAELAAKSINFGSLPGTHICAISRIAA